VLTALQFRGEPKGDGWRVTPPPTRLDIQAGAADLIEELARVYGYDHLPDTRLSQPLPEQLGNHPLELEEHVRDLLADQGLQECITNSLTGVETEAVLTVPKPDDKKDAKAEPEKSKVHVHIVNPISPDRAVLRTTLLPILLGVAKKNLEVTDAVTLFEIGPVYLPVEGHPLPAEPRRLALVLCGRRSAAAWDDPLGTKPAQFDFFDLKGVAEGLATDLHLPGVSFRPAKSAPHLHPGRSAELLLNGTAVGSFGELHPTVAANAGLGERAVQVAEFDLDALLGAVPERYPYRPFPTVPPAKRDIAVIVPADTPADAVLAEIRAAGGDLLTGAELFDVYTGDRIPAGTRSLAFALVYQAADKTLTDKEIDKAHQKIEGRLRHVLKAQVRGKDV
jgi:phenylalanyl-tRNA synthetase beta chain